MRRVNVMLDEETERGLKAIGAGNLSAGIRAAWRMIKSIMPLRRRK